MKYYQEISLLPNADIASYFLWQKLYQQIHLGLVENKTNDNKSLIGAAFPDYDASHFSLGTKLRLFSEELQTLEQMQCEEWISRLSDYFYLAQIMPVPSKVDGYACFNHFKLKGSKEKLARRRAKRKMETFEQALAYYSDYEEQRSRLPYINMTSQTNGQHFRLFIEKQLKEQEQKGLFSCYGLSNSSTVPLF